MKLKINIKLSGNIFEVWRNYLEAISEYLTSKLGNSAEFSVVHARHDLPHLRKSFSKRTFDENYDEDCIEIIGKTEGTKSKECIISINFDRYKKKVNSHDGIYISFLVNEQPKYVRISKIEYNISILDDDSLIKEFESFLKTGKVLDEYYFRDHVLILSLHKAATM